MKRGAALALAFVLGITLGLLTPLQLNKEQKIASEKPSFDTGVIIPALSISVYDKDGRLIRSFTKVGDLPTKNFLKWLMHTWWYYTSSINIVNGTWTSDDGSSVFPSTGATHGGYYSNVGGVSSITLKVALGNGTTAPTIDDYALESEVDEAPVTYYVFDANSTHMWIEVKATYTATSPINITEIGLFGYMYSGSATSPPHRWFLLFRDVISQISLDVDQTLEVRYYIYVKYG